MARSAVLAGRTLADLAAASLPGHHGRAWGWPSASASTAEPAAILAGLAAGPGFGYAFSWMYATIGLATKDPETAQVAGILPFFVLMFASNAIVPVATMPGWLQPFARNQPLSVTVSAVRALVQGGPVAHYLWQSLAWCAAMIAVFLPISLHLYRHSGE